MGNFTSKDWLRANYDFPSQQEQSVSHKAYHRKQSGGLERKEGNGIRVSVLSRGLLTLVGLHLSSIVCHCYSCPNFPSSTRHNSIGTSSPIMLSPSVLGEYLLLGKVKKKRILKIIFFNISLVHKSYRFI